MATSRILARAAALLLLAPLWTVTSTVLPADGAAMAYDVDSDGDGLADSLDGCPTVASGNPTGCPTAARNASLRWLDGRNRLQARISSPVDACVVRARISLWRADPRGDVKLGSVQASFRGRYGFKVRPARYYVTLAPSYASGKAECDRATSRTVVVPRG
jgi:hypothetical protein